MKQVALLLLLGAAAFAKTPVSLAVQPSNPLLFGKGARQALVVVARYADGTEEDVTRKSRFTSLKPSIASVDETGVVIANASGGGAIEASYMGLEASTTALIQRADAPMPLGFAGDVLPVLTKYGCNGGNCHGALNGKNGFKLSLFGYEPDADYEMIVRAHDGRRLDRTTPERSLLLLKPAFEIPHGGGKLIRKGSADYNTLLEWIRNGATRAPAERRMVALQVLPAKVILSGKESTRQLLVTARFTDGSERDITQLVKFQSNDDSIASVSPTGVVSADRGGETAIVVRAPGLAAAAKVGVVTVPRTMPEVSAFNFVDTHVLAKLKELQLPPSELCDDATFLRRASLDVIGLIPNSDEVRAFVADTRPDKRARAVDELLKRPEYADFWSNYWGDHLNNTKQLLYNKGPYTFTRWLYDAFRKNIRYDEFARELLTSSGPMFDAPATSYYPLMKKELDLASITSQLFLGVSIECARCHNHPLEKWTRDDFHGMAAFFSQIRYKNGTGPRNNERTLYLDFKRQFQHPDSKQVYLPKPLAGKAISAEDESDRRELLADWMTSPQNPYFAKALVNRMWRNFMGRGLVEPVDDFRDTNPATNAPLLNAMAEDFVQHGYDIHHLIRTITSSRSYQLSSIPSEANKDDKMAYSRFFARRLTAEQLLDSISQATEVPEAFGSLYPGTHASQLPEPEIESYFLEVFDRPSRQIVCERKQPPTLNQALHLISGDTIHKKITDSRSVLVKLRGRALDQAVEELYLRTVSRYPDAAERTVALAQVSKAKNEQQGLEDVFWALLNSKEFLYNH